MCQTLVPTVDGTGRVAAVEVMVCNPGVRAMIRDGKLQQIPGALQSGAKDGMQTLNAHLAAHVRAGRISREAALEHCSDREDLLAARSGRRPSLRAPPTPGPGDRSGAPRRRARPATPAGSVTRPSSGGPA